MTYQYIDIETVPEERDLLKLSDRKQKAFLKKFNHILSEGTDASELYSANAGLYAEYGKIVAVSIGYHDQLNDSLRITGYSSRHEKELLLKVKAVLDKASRLCAHNGLDFDYPVLARRMIIHGIPLPKVLDVIGKKPWEVSLDDTMNMWGVTQWKHKTSLELLCECLGIESSKTNLDGASVAEFYYSMFNADNDDLPFDEETRVLEGIKSYCNEDVIALAKCHLKIIGAKVFDKVQIV